MPGMSASDPQAGRDNEEQSIDSSVSPSRNSTSYGSESRNPGGISAGFGSPLSLTPASKLEHPSETQADRTLSMSPTQGRISPERLDRPPSPTKGMGGFVQSAMMKRSDSVSKRWSVQSPGLTRGNSVASNRNSQEVTSTLGGERGRQDSQEPRSRPSSSHSNTTVTQERPGTATSMRSSMTSSTTDEGFVKPTLPASRSRSPTKTSWLESALNKPESPKPKATPPPQQPSWRTEINKAKNKSVDLGQSPVSPVKHEVKLGGLLRSPPPGGITKSPGIGGFPAGFSPSLHSRVESLNSSATGSPLATSKSPSSSVAKIKPETPPKKDFRATLKSRQPPPDSGKVEEPEFKAAFGQLKRAKTQNYVAPDLLKDNINRGKNALNTTGGPVKTERKDEFREAILKKKDDFKAVQAEGKTALRAASGEQKEKAIPEAILKRQVLGRSGSITTTDSLESSSPQSITPRSPKPPSLVKETSAPARLQGKEPAGGKLASRFNPALAGLLARGPPSITSETSRSSSPVSVRTASISTSTTNTTEPTKTGPQLTHMTKGRARGPRRKAPSATPRASNNVPLTSEQSHEPAAKEVIEPAKQLALEPKPQSIPKPSISENSSPAPETDTTSQPSSPRKLDMKRRSQFLQDFTSTSTEPLSPRPLSPTKRENVVATPAKPIHQEKKPDIKVKPDTPVKSPSLKSKLSPKVSSEAVFTDIATTKRAEIMPSSSSLSVAPLRIKSPGEPLKVAEEQPTSPRKNGQVEPAVSVRGAAAMWSKTTEAPLRTKSPIKLPTHADEKAILIEAGLRSPSPEKGRPTRGLGIQNSSRPLPTPPFQSSMSPPPSAGLVRNTNLKALPPSPSQVASNKSLPLPPSSQGLVLDFFTNSNAPAAFSVDTAGILSSRPKHDSHIKTLRSSLFQLSFNGKKQPVPTHQERMLFESNLYICTHIYGDAAGKKFSEVYYWVGDDVQEQTVNECKVFAQREARAAGGELVILKQGKESPEFLAALGGIIIIRRGSANKYDSLAPHILCGRKHFGHIVFDEVDFAATALCSGFAYLISSQTGKSFLWRGKGVHADELSCARLIGMDFGITGNIEEIEDGNEPESFIQIFGPNARLPNSADHWKLKPSYDRYCGRLFLANDSKEQVSSPLLSTFAFFRAATNASGVKKQITEISPYTQADLDPANIYILDAFFEIYIITGYQAQSQYAAFHHALTFAQEYGILAAGMEDRPRVPFTTVVMEGVPKDMKSLFRKWRDELSPTVTQASGLQRGKSLRVLGLNAALEALKI